MHVPPAELVDLPRVQAGAQPQHLLTTLLGDYWVDRLEHIPSVVLVSLLADFEVSTVGARAALSRLSRRGLLESSRIGRNTYYGLAPDACAAIRVSMNRILTFGLRHDPWDGRWTVASFSIPEGQRDVRHAVRARLRWLGFAPLYDGMWVTPRLVGEAARRVFAELGVTASTVLITTSEARRTDPRPPMAAWDLSELARAYEDFISAYEPLLERVRSGDVHGAEALAARTAVMESWARFPTLDPDLPIELLPGGWPRREARTVFAEVYDGLAAPAASRVRELLAAVSPDLADLVRVHRAVG
ncbi:PaaX family transcriptional regulator C-terminal domain-containing protein [Parafrankia sp. EUN1f]|uniref:PaaX family transcriptional regulator n=1 Tax=Parafrankia sp. EUN1f TaxID=102897 RepID=UPI0001C459D9|nr:PaaX family transcriptional regulator C-terminal domain-containing protein [Parafrankia sp. EUN1f]EFC84594.1 transcriptional regulator, PaaX family [Parafrankia sp. EUN1f]